MPSVVPTFVPDDDPAFRSAAAEAIRGLTNSSGADAVVQITTELADRWPNVAVVADDPESTDESMVPAEVRWTFYRDGAAGA